MGTLVNDRAAGRRNGKKVAAALLAEGLFDLDDDSLIDRALDARAHISTGETWGEESNKSRSELLYDQWDEGFWETFNAARDAAREAA